MNTHPLAREMAIIAEAQEAARTASTLKINENPGVWFPCGFSWVIIKPARGKLIKALDEMGLGKVSVNGGYMVYNPGEHPTQWMDAKSAGSRAFIEVLLKHYPKLNIYQEDRMD
jgi:hypothetical protein